MDYNGLGQRLSMTGYALGTSVITNYVLDPMQYAHPLTATSGGNTTVYLYGIDPIAEFTTGWSYSLPDGTNTPRQLTNVQGEITLSARYTPWGDTLDTYGTVNFSYGYLGGVLDAATGLIYVGNGQYYDPQTGRFLTRDVYPNSPNPYVPWNPLGAILAPLALISLFYTRKKKESKTGTFLVLLLVLGGVGMTLAACGPVTTPTAPAPNPTPVPTSTPDDSAPAVPPSASPPWGPATVIATLLIATASPIDTPTMIPCLTPLENVPMPSSSLEQIYKVTFKEDGMKWSAQDKDSALRAIVKVAEKFALILGGTAADAWARTYEYMEFQMGNCSGCVEGGEHAGYTIDSHHVEFAGISNTGEKGRNLVVHELGHAFKALLNHKTGINVYSELTAWRENHPSYPDRLPFNGGRADTGPSYGFASLQNQTLWQVSLEGGDDEEFADQFLGWVFDMWEADLLGLTDDGKARADMMNANMPYWVMSSTGP